MTCGALVGRPGSLECALERHGPETMHRNGNVTWNYDARLDKPREVKEPEAASMLTRPGGSAAPGSSVRAATGSPSGSLTSQSERRKQMMADFPGVDRVFGDCSVHGPYELPLGSIDSGEIPRRCPQCADDSFEYIRDYYRVPARKGMLVMFDGWRNAGGPAKRGRITGTEGQYLRVLFDDGTTEILHPTWRVEYLEGE